MCATIVLCSNEHVLVCVCVICAHLPRGLPTFASKDGGLTINVLPVFGDLDDLKFLAPAGTRRLRDQVQKREPADLGWASPLPSTWGGALLLPPTVLPPPRASAPAGPCAGHDPSGQPRGSGAGALSPASVTPVASKPLFPRPHWPDHAAQDVAARLLFLGPTGAAANGGLGAPAQRTPGQRGLPGLGLTRPEPAWPMALMFFPSCPPAASPQRPPTRLGPRAVRGWGWAGLITTLDTPGEAGSLPGGHLQPPWPARTPLGPLKQVCS